MIIKEYAADGSTYIHENLTDIVVQGGIYLYEKYDDIYSTDFGPQAGGRSGVRVMDWHPKLKYKEKGKIQDIIIKDNGNKCKFIDFTNNENVCHRLVVEHLAYICNDEGKTIETVKV